MNDWYQSLQRPALTPPNWIFGPVWTVLYIMIAVSIFLILKNYKGDFRYGVYALIVFHLFTNLAWTALFFRLHNPGLALIDIILLDLSLIVMICLFWQTNKVASVLLWPYLLWVMFATYLNIGFYVLNRS